MNRIRSLLLGCVILILLFNLYGNAVTNFGTVPGSPESILFVASYGEYEEIIIETGLGSGYEGGVWYFNDSNFSQSIPLGTDLFIWVYDRATNIVYTDSEQSSSIPVDWGLAGESCEGYIPRLYIVNVTPLSVKLSWGGSEMKDTFDSVTYRVYRSVVDTGSPNFETFLGEVSDSCFIDTSIEFGIIYFYTVVPIVDECILSHTNVVIADVPLNIKISNKAIIWGSIKCCKQ